LQLEIKPEELLPNPLSYLNNLGAKFFKSFLQTIHECPPGITGAFVGIIFLQHLLRNDNLLRGTNLNLKNIG
jgi:hypothetical protein